MSTPQTFTSVSEQEKCLLLKLKMALAVAVIKSRPRGTSTSSYCLELSSNLRNHEANWRRRAEELKKEVLRLRQELVLQEARASEEETESEVQELFSQDLFAPIKDTDQNLESNSETPELILDQDNTYVLPAADEAAAADVSRPPFSRPLEPLPHIHFLQALCSLQTPTGGAVLGSSTHPSHTSAGGAVLEESVLQLLQSVCAVSIGRASVEVSSLVSACGLCVSALELLPGPSVDFRVRLEQLVGDLVQALNQGPHQQGPHQQVLDALLVLSRSGLLRCFLIRQIVYEVRDVTRKLWTLHQSSDPDLDSFPMVQYQNSCLLMWLLEQLLKTSPPIREPDTDSSDLPTYHSPGEEEASKQPQQCRASGFVDSDGPMTAGLSSNGPMTAGLSSNGPMTAGLSSNGPMTAGLSSNGPMAAGLSSNGPMTAGLNSNEPMTAGLSSNEPMTAGLSSNRPIRVDMGRWRQELSEVHQCVFPLSQERPLFCVCVWRVLNL